MKNYILTDQAGVVVACMSVQDSDLQHQAIPEGLTMHVGLTARPFLDRIADGAIVPNAIAVPCEERKMALLARLAERRWQVETGGIDVGGVHIATDDRSKLLLANAATRAREDPAYSVRWKTSPGQFSQISASEIVAADAAVYAHVQRCFAREAELSDQLEAAKKPEALADAVEGFWP